MKYFLPQTLFVWPEMAVVSVPLLLEEGRSNSRLYSRSFQHFRVELEEWVVIMMPYLSGKLLLHDLTTQYATGCKRTRCVNDLQQPGGFISAEHLIIIVVTCHTLIVRSV